MIGNIIQPPDLTNSHTVNVPSKKCATLPYRVNRGVHRLQVRLSRFETLATPDYGNGSRQKR
ncbi:hypothetical protein JX616_26925, partial [Klebsiella pneumoniae]|uniref:hypothetical protein n=1 Tax=Klebsiella pneumoniae TaxID=573 RepID=UPI0019D3FBDC